MTRRRYGSTSTARADFARRISNIWRSMTVAERFAHQEEEWEHRYDTARALLWQMRTGKTRTVVEHACALYDSLSINGVVVVAPNGVHRQWAEEQIHMWGRGKQDGFAWRYSDPDN